MQKMSWNFDGHEQISIDIDRTGRWSIGIVVDERENWRWLQHLNGVNWVCQLGEEESKFVGWENKDL